MGLRRSRMPQGRGELRDQPRREPRSPNDTTTHGAPCDTHPMDAGREARWEKDAMTVEIGFALFTGALLAGLVFALAAAPTWIGDLTPHTEHRIRVAAATLGCAAGIWRAVRVL